jgi:DHA1 family tetracycline resistance protein-like MFS transporter
VQGGLSGYFTRVLGEKKTAFFGLLTVIVVMVGISIVPYGWMLYLVMLPYSFSGIIDPAIRTIVSAGTPQNEQGELQGVFTSIMSLAEIIGPPFFMWIYSTSRHKGPNEWWGFGAPFLVASAIAAVAMFYLWWALRNFKGIKKVNEVESPNTQVDEN